MVADGVSLFTKDIPENDRRAGPFRLGQIQEFEPRLHLGAGRSWSREAREIALDIGEKHGHADARKLLGENLKRDRFPGPGRAGDQAVAIGHRGEQSQVERLRLGDDERRKHGEFLCGRHRDHRGGLDRTGGDTIWLPEVGSVNGKAPLDFDYNRRYLADIDSRFSRELSCQILPHSRDCRMRKSRS